MVNLETLTARSLCRYEIGRLCMALRVGFILVPLAALCLLEPVGREACLCCAVLLLAATVWLRFRNRSGVDSVRTGLLSGAMPLAAGLLLAGFDPNCAAAGAISYCTGISLLVGTTAGVVVVLLERDRVRSSAEWLLPLGLALLTASMGCARLGAANLVGVATGLLLGGASKICLSTKV